jgi:PAS domain-containing protein
MPQQPIEVILLRQVASYLTVPVFLVDEHGNLLYYNEPAETLLGRRFEEAGEMPVDELASIFKVTDLEAEPIPPDELPITVALQKRKPAHRRIRVHGLDGVWRTIDVTSFPVEGQSGRHLGAVAMFWEPHAT